MKQHKIIKRGYYVVRIDTKIWYKIKKFIHSNYSKMSITIEREDSVDVLDGMDLAFKIIKEHTAHINKIIIQANNNNESAELILNTKRLGQKWSIYISFTYNDPERGRELRILADSLIVSTRVSTNLIRISAVFYFYAILIYLMDLVNLDILHKWFFLPSLAAVIIWGVLIDFYIYSPIMEDLLYGRQRVEFWLDDESIKKYKHLKIRGTTIGCIMLVVSLIVLIFTILK